MVILSETISEWNVHNPNDSMRGKARKDRDRKRVWNTPCSEYIMYREREGGGGVEEDEKGQNGGVRIIYNRGNASVNILWDKFSNALSPLMWG